MIAKLDKRRGFTLLEMLCAIALLLLVLGVSAVILNETLEMERLQRRGFEQMQECKELADQFRTDVAQAESAPAEWNQYKADQHTLILHLKDKGHVVYLWREGKLQRGIEEGEKTSTRSLPIDAMPVELAFVRELDRRMVRLRLAPQRGGKLAVGQTLEIAAALGGDWR